MDLNFGVVKYVSVGDNHAPGMNPYNIQYRMVEHRIYDTYFSTPVQGKRGSGMEKKENTIHVVRASRVVYDVGREERGRRG